MGEVIRAFHGTRDIEGIIRDGSIQSNYLQIGGRGTFYNSMKKNYDLEVESLYEEGRAILSNGGFLGQEMMNERLNSFPEAIADLMELWKGKDSIFKELKRNLFVYFTNSLNTARGYCDGEGVRGTSGMLEVNLNSDLIRRGLAFYKNQFHFIEFPREVPLDRAVSIYVQRSDFLSVLSHF